MSSLKSGLYFVRVVLNSSIKWSSVKFERCLDLIIFSVEYENLQRKSYVDPFSFYTTHTTQL